MAHWLMKTEPEVFGIDDLERVGVEPWNGVRNYQARNFLREMRVGDGVLIYHSNAQPPGIAGLGRIVAAAKPDPSQFDPSSEYHDPKSPADRPRWDLVDVAFVEKFPRLLSLEELRAQPALAEMIVLRRGNRLSVTPVSAAEYRRIAQLGRRGA